MALRGELVGSGTCVSQWKHQDPLPDEDVKCQAEGLHQTMSFRKGSETLLAVRRVSLTQANHHL